MLCECGMFGLPVFVFMLGKMLKDRFKQQRVLEAALLIGIGIVFFPGFICKEILLEHNNVAHDL